jgi:hypothetical protein
MLAALTDKMLKGAPGETPIVNRAVLSPKDAGVPSFLIE